jgi:hypothetical protein
MAQVADAHDYAYMGKWCFDRRRLLVEPVDEVNPLTNETMPEELL